VFRLCPSSGEDQAPTRHQRKRSSCTARSPWHVASDANRFFADHDYAAVGMDHLRCLTTELAQARRGLSVMEKLHGLHHRSRAMELVGFRLFGHQRIPRFVLCRISLHRKPTPTPSPSDRGPVHTRHKLDEEDRARKEIINHLMCNLEIDLPAESSCQQQRPSQISGGRARVT